MAGSSGRKADAPAFLTRRRPELSLVICQLPLVNQVEYRLGAHRYSRGVRFNVRLHSSRIRVLPGRWHVPPALCGRYRTAHAAGVSQSPRPSGLGRCSPRESSPEGAEHAQGARRSAAALRGLAEMCRLTPRAHARAYQLARPAGALYSSPLPSGLCPLISDLWLLNSDIWHPASCIPTLAHVVPFSPPRMRITFFLRRFCRFSPC